MNFTFHRKIIVLTLSLVAVTQIATLASVRTIATRNITQSAADSLVLGCRVFDEFMGNRAAQFETTLRVIAADFGFKQAVATNDVATISSALDNHRRRAGADMALLLDLDGQVRAISGSAEETMISTSLPELTRYDGDTQSTHSVARLQGTYFQTFATSVRAPVPVAWVILGYRLDQVLANRVSMLTGLDVTFVDTAKSQRGIISSTLNPGKLRQLGDSLYDNAAAASTGVASVREIGRGDAVFFSAWHPFEKNTNNIAAVLQVSLAEAYKPYAKARNAAVIFAAIAMLIAVVAAGWLANAVAFPVRRLAEAASRLAVGDYDTVVKVRSRDELGALADSFNQMRLAVAEREKKIRYAADYDQLTGLPNRSHLMTSMRHLIDRPNKTATFAVVKLEISQFSQLTATLGYAAGEEIARLVASRLSGQQRDEKLLAHVDGGEFVSVLPDVGQDSALAYVRQVQAVLATGVRVHDASINLSCVAGIALYPEHGVTPDELLRRASIAKSDAHDNDVAMHCYQQGREKGQIRRLRIIGDMKNAIAENQLRLVYQPKLRIADDRVTSVEALVRWKHPELGPLAPDEFVGLAEQFGIIDQLTNWVIATAIAQCKAWQDQSLTLDVAVNLSARDLMDEHLPVFVKDTLRKHGIDATQLTIEITESAIMGDLEKCISVLDCLRGIGVRIAIDDFGTGHSSLLQLKHMPLHELKIDRSFVAGLLDNQRDDAIVRTTMDLAHRLGLEVVAEGIESDDVLARLAEMGCEYAQGYSIARPLEADSLLEWVTSHDNESQALVSA